MWKMRLSCSTSTDMADAADAAETRPTTFSDFQKEKLGCFCGGRAGGRKCEHSLEMVRHITANIVNTAQ